MLKIGGAGRHIIGAGAFYTGGRCRGAGQLPTPPAPARAGNQLPAFTRPQSAVAVYADKSPYFTRRQMKILY